ncbi:MAG: DUF547 domain-containing protein [Gammaproteobacteria bacterium]
MLLVLLVSLVSFVSGCAILPPEIPAKAQTGPLPTMQQANKAWAEVLHRYVNDSGHVAFHALAKHPELLHEVVRWVGAVTPRNHPALFPNKDAVLAYNINAYNALAMNQILRFGIPKELSLFTRYRFFVSSVVMIGGKKISLEDYEDMIRKLGNPLVHVALNCMSASCPQLPRVPFAAATIQKQLNSQAHRFFNKTRNVRVDNKTQTVYFSKILDFYTSDFKAVAPSLIAFVNRYREQKIPKNYHVRFMDYNWTVVQQH